MELRGNISSHEGIHPHVRGILHKERSPDLKIGISLRRPVVFNTKSKKQHAYLNRIL